MLHDAIRSVLEGDTGDLTNQEIARLVVERLPPEEMAAALVEALGAVISQQRSVLNRRLLHERPPADSGSGARIPESGSVVPGGTRYGSARAALISDRLLEYSITGASGRSIPLRKAGIADLRFEITVSRKRGATLTARAEIFDDMLHEMAENGIKNPANLPRESRENYARRIARLAASFVS